MKKPKIRFKGYQEDWEQRKFADVVDIGSGMDYKHLEEGNIPVYGTGGYLLSVNKALSDDKDAIGIGRKGTIDKPYILRAPFWTVDTLFYCIPKENYDLDFTSCIFQNVDWKKKDESTGVPSLSKVIINNVETATPTMDEQQKIGEYFSNLDHLITLHHRKYMKYADLSVFDWEQRKLGDVFEQTANFVNPNDDDIELWSLTVEDGLTPKSERYNREFLVKKKTNFKEVRPGDIVYNPMNMTLGAVGFNGMAKSVAVSGYYTTMVANKGYDSYYINTWLKSPQAISLYKTFATGSLKEKQRVQFPTLSIIPATFPEHDEQTKIGSYFEHLDHLITLHQRKCEETKTLKKYMLQKMFPQNGHSVPEIRFSGFTEDWEQRKFGEIVQKYEDPVETPAEGYMRLGIRSHAKGTFHSYVEKGKELETAKMFRVAANNFIVNITFGWEHAVAITDESDAGKLVSHRFPQYSFKEGMNPRFFKYLILDECFRHHLELSSPGGAGRNRVLKLNEMLEYKMKFPQMEEQEEIAIYFEQLDNLITLHHRKQNYVLNTLIYAKTTLFITKTS